MLGVAQLLECLKSALRSDGDARVRARVDSIFWHRVDLGSRMREALRP
jgi:hypothetical protein